MFLIKSKPIARARRFQRLNLILSNWNKRFLYFNKKYLHQPNRYHQTYRPKHVQSGKFNYTSLSFFSLFFCINVFQTNRFYKSLYKSLTGVFNLTPLIDCIGIGDRINFYKNATRFYYFIYAGSVIQLKYLKIGFIISNIGNTINKWASSNGTYCHVLNLKNLSCRIKLPSGINYDVSSNMFCIIGRNAGIYTYKQYFGKASSIVNGIRRIIVRSCAKNPIDHPNGGRTRGKMTFKTPWGKIAKSNK